MKSLFCGYISGTNSFPQPLTPDEELKYFQQYKNGSDDAKNILIERNLRLVAHIAKNYISIHHDSEDLISIGTIGLIKAITTFDYQKGVRFSSYATRCIDNEILMQLRTTKKMANDVSLYDYIASDKDGKETTLLDLLSNEEEPIDIEVELKSQVQRLYNKMKAVLKSTEKVILELRYGLLNQEIHTQNEIAALLGISRSYVSRIEKKALKKLRQEFNSEDFI